jgi:chaperonin GroEL
MAAKRFLFGQEGRARLLEGSRILAGAVKPTLGPGGRTIFLEMPMHAAPQVTKDGVTVAEQIELGESFANMGAQLVLESAVQTGNTAGDGTTTATVLAHVIYREGIKLVAAGYHPLALKRGIDAGVERVVAALAKMSKRVMGGRDVAKVATISANGDTAIGKLIAQAIGKVGLEGIIHVEQGEALETKLEVAEGAEIEGGYSSAYFVTDMERLVAHLDNPYILLCPNKISAISELLPILEKVAKTGRSLLVVAELGGEALSLLVVNKLQGAMKVCAVKAPYYGESRTTSLHDLAAQTGGRVLGEEAGIALAAATLEDLGRAKKIVVDQEKTTIVGGATDKKALEARVHEIRALYADTNSTFRHQRLEDRLRRLAGGAALIRVGGTTDAETRERKLRIEDALFATRAAIEEGTVPGGGIALLRAAEVLAQAERAKPKTKTKTKTNTKTNGVPEEHQAGIGIVRRACEAPCRQIAENAGKDPSVILARVRERRGAHGYNAARDTFENLIDAGVVDPTMVVRLALQHAASIAGLLLSSEALIVDGPRAPVDYPDSGSAHDALSVEPIISRRDRGPVGGRSS